MKDLFDFHGSTISDVIYECSVVFSIKLDEWLESIDWNVVFLAKFGGLNPEWVEAQDIARQNSLIRVVNKFIEAQYGGGQTPVSDSEKEWL